MKTLEFIKLNESGANNVVASLQQLLADFQVYYTNLRGFHWNIKGHDFFVLHSQFEKMYDDTAEKVDEIAERILMLGGTPANKFSDYLKVANINEVDKVSNGEQALDNILQSISYLIGEERKILSIASQAGDEVTVSMMSDYLKEQEKLVTPGDGSGSSPGQEAGQMVLLSSCLPPFGRFKFYLCLNVIRPRVKSYGEISTVTLSPGKMRM